MDTKRAERSARGKKRKPPFNIIRVLLVLGICMMAVTAVGDVYRWFHVHQEVHRLEKQVEVLRKERDQKAEEAKKLEDTKAIEQEAREQLGLVKPGEVPYVK